MTDANFSMDVAVAMTGRYRAGPVMAATVLPPVIGILSANSVCLCFIFKSAHLLIQTGYN